MDDPDRVNELISDLHRADEQTAAELFARYARRLTVLAEQHLDRRVAGRVDGDDVVQSVFRSFFARCERGDFQIDSSAQLWRLLLQITIRKARAQNRRHTSGNRDVRREAAPIDENWFVRGPGREPDPAEAAVLVDEIRHLLDGLPPRYGQVLELRLAEYPVAEIAERLAVSRQTVYRVLELLQQRLKEAASDLPA
jgi:RNA polymerase sigma-70 factor (ECF subfamily)